MTVTASKYPLKKNDLYETEAWAVFAVIKALKDLELWRDGTIWEPAAGTHAMVSPFYRSGAKTVITSDICTYGPQHSFMMDFLEGDEPNSSIGEYDLISNPPYGRQNRLAVQFAEKSLLRCEGYVALLLTAKFDFGSTRTHLFRDNDRFRAKVALIDRVSWEGNGETGTEDHAWYIWGPKDTVSVNTELLYQGKHTNIDRDE
jgi:hypothetical protein